MNLMRFGNIVDPGREEHPILEQSAKLKDKLSCSCPSLTCPKRLASSRFQTNSTATAAADPHHSPNPEPAAEPCDNPNQVSENSAAAGDAHQCAHQDGSSATTAATGLESEASSRQCGSRHQCRRLHQELPLPVGHQQREQPGHERIQQSCSSSFQRSATEPAAQPGPRQRECGRWTQRVCS